ncbi:TonB-dependent receptor [Pseudoalteromonas luteoviolacea]|uniref:TonB-denpendent receptor n=1 Tax=Pseudoalteromonas luteoviolacea H33 TaxID=1365251 RepID=A0A167D6G3_9GAMM|nr:TonB-dependent receptor [Pseudoalteromonas luteoviolacea]KZN48470.1 hypothetical protein N476_21600 [Pseudoalteromonas luteoviolacea H33]KZN73331.1 hypothetical protein N477_23700 [Pseudoalteromonas luteoviolacea H33-S]
MLANNFKKSLLAANIGLALTAGVSGVAVADSGTQVKEDVEVIEVRGIRRSLEASINTKRFATSVVDAVTAEDVGKFPDSDVGETLGRIPGVAVNRQFGQGQQVSIRGASATLTRTLLNGHTVASTGWYDQQAIDRSFNYTLLPPELIGGIEVYKSSQANIVEGGVGGTVIVKTRKPLDLDANTTFIGIKGDYGTASESTDPQLSGLYSWKNADETIGFLGSVAYAETNYQRNGIETLAGWGEISPTTFQQERERTAISTSIQFRPNDQFQVSLNLMSLELEADNANTSIYTIFGDKKDESCTQTNANGTCIVWERPGTGDFGGWIQTWARAASMQSDTYDVDFEYETDDYKLTGRVGMTEAEGGTDLTANFGQAVGEAKHFAGTYDLRGDVVAISGPKKNWVAGDFNDTLSAAGWSLKNEPNTDEETYAQLDLELPVDFGAITAIHTGFRWADHEVKKDAYAAVTVAEINKLAGSELYSGTVSSGAGYVLPEPNLDRMLAEGRAAIASFDKNVAGIGTITEENLAVYVMADFSADSVRGNFGLRYISTDAESTYHPFVIGSGYQDTLGKDESDYSQVLPSLNLAFDVKEDVILRFSAAQVISRPNYEDLFSGATQIGLNDGTPNNEVLRYGTISLNPVKATQADLGFEYYFDNDALFAMTYFFKDISSFVTSDQVADQQIGIVDNNTGADSWTIETLYNGNGGTIEGIEVQLQDGFDNGFGYAVNYTYAEGSAPGQNYSDGLSVFSDSSKHTVNMVGYYETDLYSIRLAYNWRSEYMIREGAKFYGNREHQDYGSLDLSANYKVTDYLDVTFEAVNLTEEDSIQIGTAASDSQVKRELQAGFPAWSYEGEARYRVGLNFRF